MRLIYFCRADIQTSPTLMPRVIHCIIHDLLPEHRLHKIVSAMAEICEVEVVSVLSPVASRSLPQRPYRIKRLWIPVGRGPFFFLLGNLWFFIYLLLRKNWDAVVANDLAALPGTWLASVLRRKALLLDSRELFTQTPFVVHRPFRRRLWEMLERFLYARVDYIITVSPPIARYFEQKYKKPVWLVYNLPPKSEGFACPRLEDRLLLYQGMLHPCRGLEELILALSYAEGWRLWIVGDGPTRASLEKLVAQHALEERVRFLGMVPFESLKEYTCQATFGISGELPRGLNHEYALPNKVFDYVQAGIPVIVGEAPLIRKVVEHYGCGYVVERWTPREIAKALNALACQQELYERLVEGARKAARELYWERQIPCIRAWLVAALEGRPLPPQEAEEKCREVVEITKIFEGV
ncbi:MAG: glycosyltransferase [Bacteroidia bacterium]|nr:glycosyltransferase [Bacteroidia bacterium]